MIPACCTYTECKGLLFFDSWLKVQLLEKYSCYSFLVLYLGLTKKTSNCSAWIAEVCKIFFLDYENMGLILDAQIFISIFGELPLKKKNIVTQFHLVHRSKILHAGRLWYHSSWLSRFVAYFTFDQKHEGASGFDKNN